MSVESLSYGSIWGKFPPVVYDNLYLSMIMIMIENNGNKHCTILHGNLTNHLI